MFFSAHIGHFNLSLDFCFGQYGAIQTRCDTAKMGKTVDSKVGIEAMFKGLIYHFAQIG